MKTTPLIDPQPRKPQAGLLVTRTKFSSSDHDLNLADLKFDHDADGGTPFIRNRDIDLSTFSDWSSTLNN